MELNNIDIEMMKEQFKSCQNMLTAIGDETRQYLLLQVLGDCRGRRVVDIADRMKLSRAAVSHHIQIVKNAGVVKSRKEGSFIYYYIDLDSNCMQSMIDLFTKIQEVMNQLPDRSGEI